MTCGDPSIQSSANRNSERDLAEFRKYISRNVTTYDSECVCRFVSNNDFHRIMNLMSEFHERESFEVHEIPSAIFDEGCYRTLAILSSGNLPIKDLGRLLLSGDRKDGALYKYAELRSKLLSQIDAVVIWKNEETRLNNAYITPFGTYLAKMDMEASLKIIRRLGLTLPHIHCAFRHLVFGKYNIDSLFELAKPSVISRRGASLRGIIQDAAKEYCVNYHENLISSDVSKNRHNASRDSPTSIDYDKNREDKSPRTLTQTHSDIHISPEMELLIEENSPHKPIQNSLDVYVDSETTPLTEDELPKVNYNNINENLLIESEIPLFVKGDSIEDDFLARIKRSVSNTMTLAPP